MPEQEGQQQKYIPVHQRLAIARELASKMGLRLDDLALDFGVEAGPAMVVAVDTAGTPDDSATQTVDVQASGVKNVRRRKTPLVASTAVAAQQPGATDGTSSPGDDLPAKHYRINQKAEEKVRFAAGALAHPDNAPPDAAPVVVPAPPDNTLPPEVKKIWTVGSLLNEIQDGTEFLLKSPNDPERTQFRYRRDGNDIVNKNSKVMTAQTLNRLERGWTLEKEIKAATAVAALTPDATTSTPSDATVAPGIAEVKKGENKELGAEQYDELRQGDMWLLRNVDGSIRKKIEVIWFNETMKDAPSYMKKGKRVSITTTRNTTQSPKTEAMDLEDFRSMLRDDGYTLETRGTKSEREIFNEGSRDDDDFYLVGGLDPVQERIDNLRTIVGERRLEYVTRDYNQNSTWKKLKNFFGKSLDGGQSDTDTKATFATYRLALTKLQEAELEQLKASGLSGKPLQERMGQMLKYYQLDEAARLFETRNEIKIESKNWGQRVILAAENVGRWYNKLPRWEKYALAGMCLGAGVFGGAAAGGGLVVARRVLSGAGLAVAIDAGIEQWQEKKKLAAFEVEKERNFKLLGEIQEDGGDLGAVLGSLLKEKFDSLGSQFQKQKRDALWRRTVAWGGAGAVVFGGSFLASEIKEAIQDGSSVTSGSGRIISVPGVTESSEAAASAPMNPASDSLNMVTPRSAVILETPVSSGGASVGETNPQWHLPHDVAPGTSETPMTGGRPIMVDHTAGPGTETVAAKVEALREQYEVTKLDGKKGLWGVLERRLPEGLPKGDKSRVIQSLENAMRAKLDALSPAERAAAGFHGNLPSGKVNLDLIRPGDTINFNSLLTQKEIEDVLDGKSIEGSDGVPRAGLSPIDQNIIDRGEVPVSAGPTAMDQAVFDNFVEEVSVDKVDPRIGLEQAVAVENFDKLMDTKAFLAEHPDQMPLFNRALGGLRQGVFMMTGERGIPVEYDYTLNGGKLGGTTMSQILRDGEGFKRAPIGYSYDRNLNPLHYDQMMALTKLVATVQDPKIFGALGQVRAGEDVNDYTKRMATLALRMGKNIPGFFKK